MYCILCQSICLMSIAQALFSTHIYIFQDQLGTTLNSLSLYLRDGIDANAKHCIWDKSSQRDAFSLSIVIQSYIQKD